LVKVWEYTTAKATALRFNYLLITLKEIRCFHRDLLQQLGPEQEKQTIPLESCANVTGEK